MEKRFAIHRETEEDKVIFSFYDGNKQIDVEDILDLLNSLNDENEQLRQTIEEYEKSIDSMVKTATEISNRNLKWHEEISRLNNTVKELQEICTRTESEKEDYADHNGELEYELKKCREKNKELQMKLDKVMEELDQYRYDETLYAKEIVKLNKEAKEVLNFKELGGDY